MKNTGVIPKDSLRKAFVAIRLKPDLTLPEIDKLITALEAWDQREAETVVYRKFLEATY